MNLDFKKLLGNINDKKIIYISGAIGILLLFVSSFIPDKPKNVEPVEIKKDYCTELEEKLEDILPEIAGVGKVKVMITAHNNGEVILAKDKATDSEKTIVLSQKGGGEDTRVLSEAYPKIQGIVIVADGGENMQVKEKLTDAAMALLNLEAHKIIVFERKID